MQTIGELVVEALQYQNPVVFKELDLVVTEYGALPYEKFNESKRTLETTLAAILKHHFNCNVTIELGDTAPCMRIFDEYANGVLIRNSERNALARHDKFVTRFAREFESGRRSSVNIATGKLAGLFTELPFTIYMSTYMFQEVVEDSDKLCNSKELVAILLHEMGHFFTYCEYFSRTVTTNQVLASISKDLDGSYSVEKRTVIIGEVKERLKLNDLNVTALAAIDSKHVVEIAIVSEMAIKSRGELGVNIYDNYSSEQLADQFAVRLGAGRDLMTGLDKMESMFGTSNTYKGMPSYLISQFATVLLCTLIPPFFILAVTNAFLEPHAWHHEDSEARTRRVRQDMVGHLKLPRLSVEQKKSILEDIAIMDELLKKMDDKRDVFSVVVDAIIPVYRKYRHSMELQKQLETLAANTLFVRAAELSTL